MRMNGLHHVSPRMLIITVLLMVLKPSLSSRHMVNSIVHQISPQEKSTRMNPTSHSPLHKYQSLKLISIRGGHGTAGRTIAKDDDQEEYLDNFELEKLHQVNGVPPDFGGTVSGLFGNLRIPASLIAGAALGSAFGLPLKEGDGLLLGLVKRIHVLLMLGSLCSMLLTVLISTLCMNDIALSPTPKMADSAQDYIERYCLLEWMLTRTNFLWGSVVFVIGSMLRGWVFMSCPLVGRGLLGIMSSFTLIATSIVLQYYKQETGQSPKQLIKSSVEIVRSKMKSDYLFAAGIILWASTLLYLFGIIPHISRYLLNCSDKTGWWSRRR